MEDAHIAVLDLGDNADAAMFGVFDGHGGRYSATLLNCNNEQGHYMRHCCGILSRCMSCQVMSC